MGGGQSTDSEKEENKHIIFQNDDDSFIYTTIQILYNLKDFKNYIATLEFPENSPKKLEILLKRIFNKDEDKINLEKYSKKIYKLITKTYNLEVIDSPGKILTQIIEILNFEENNNKVNIWEETVSQNNQLFMNTLNQNQALNDFLNIYKKEFNNKINEFFHGTLLKRRKLQNMNNIMYFFSYYSVYELNLSYLYTSLTSKGKNTKNTRTNKDEISLFDCISDMKTPKNDIFNNQPSLVEYHMFNSPHYLIFLLNREYENYNKYFGDLIFPKEDDFSQMLVMKDKNNHYKLVSIIREKKYMVKVQKKSENTDENYEWYEEDDNKNKNDKITNKYMAIYRGEDDKFYNYNKENKKNQINLNEKDDDYYDYILVYEKIS